MLELKNVTKVYEIGKKKNNTYLKVDALKGINLKFRKSEFVSILGQSGCGKTTLLNIIGGLDNYTSGDLIINGKSTKEFNDKDWDTYRNHSIGFVFQSYNLIPHQTVLENVQLALTLSGISKKERQRRAIEVLKKVGLKDKIHSKPNQLSGGQMQRVAIARALVNDPDIILADEPTGALDSKTSVQIMDILKQISKDKLIIMVTHNPDLANTYSSRIIKLSDGLVDGDSDPYTDEAEDDKLISLANDSELSSKERKAKRKKKSMSFFTALGLSFKNLLTKKTRTFLISFAGSIGIIGIALVLSLSSGFQSYINNVQQDTLSTYPITIESATVDYSAMFEMAVNSMVDNDNNIEEVDKIYSEDVIVNMFKNILTGSKKNDLKAFKAYLDSSDEIDKYVTGIKYTYELNMNIYELQDSEAGIPTTQQLNPNNMFYQGIMEFFNAYAEKIIIQESLVDIYVKQELGITNQTPTEEEQTRIDEFKNSLTDADKSAIVQGFDEETIELVKSNITDNEKANVAKKLLDMVNSSSNAAGGLNSLMGTDLGIWSEMLDNEALFNSQYEVLAIAEGDAKTLYKDMQYNDVILVVDEYGRLSDYALYALGIKHSPTIKDIAQGMVDNMNGYIIEPSTFEFDQVIGKQYPLLLDSDYYLRIDADGNINNDSGTMVDIRKSIQSESNPTGLITPIQYQNILTDLLDNARVNLRIKAIVKPKDGVSASSISGQIAYSNKLTNHLIDMLNEDIATKGLTDKLSIIDISSPQSISLYCADFESKNKIEEFIKRYNEDKSENQQISYTDYVGIMMSSISTIINAISYVLIAFVSISLVVSSIMIGIITYISVLERIKEIGILRSIGASKRDIKRVFTAESLIIGTIAGILGIAITLLLNIVINIIINSLVSLGSVAALPIGGAFVLIAISMILTFVAGLIPARIASKKDPVVALRTE